MTATRLFATCPESRTEDRAGYQRRVIEAAQWSEEIGCEGILVYAENGLVDPWLLAQLIIQRTERLHPLVAVQPLYMHPYAVATMVASLAHLHERRVYLNMVAGGFRNDLRALGDETPHDRRYDRLLEYSEIIRDLCAGRTITRSGFYPVQDLRLLPAVDEGLQPEFMISGSSEAGLAAARALGATAVKYPQPPGQEDTGEESIRTGIRIGVIAREDREEAWRVALERFPEDRSGQITHRLAMSVSDSHWHEQLSALAHDAADRNEAYWLGPFQNYRTFCPYLVGDHATVAAEIRRYSAAGFDTFVLDIPASREELESVAAVFALAENGTSRSAVR